MRIFYAVNFADYVKSAIYENIPEIKKHTLRGNFTLQGNFHVTLLFIGECAPNQYIAFKEIADYVADKIKSPPVTAVIDGLASFARTGEELLWVGVKTEPQDILQRINAALFEEINKRGIKINDNNRNFTPHITIARKVEFWRMSSKDIHQIKFEPVNCTINSITLMESIQQTDSRTQRTRVIYEPLHEVKFTT